LSVYLYLPWRYGFQPAFNYAGHYQATGVFEPVNLRTPAGLWWLVSGRAFAGEMLAYQGHELWQEISHFGQQLGQTFFAIGLGPGLLGLVVLLRRDWRLGSMLLLMFGCSAGFYIDYRVVDKDTMFLPAYLVWALWAGVGYQWLLTWVQQVDEKEPGSTSKEIWLLRFLMTGVVMGVMAWNWQLVDQSADWSTRLRGEKILGQVEPNALIFDWWDTVPIIQYLQLVEGQRPDVQAINRFLIDPQAMQRLIQREIAHRPIYIDQLPADLRYLVKAEPVGPLYRLRPRYSPTLSIDERR
jgi:hypothetical protein